MEKKVENETETVDLGIHNLAVPFEGPDDEAYGILEVTIIGDPLFQETTTWRFVAYSLWVVKNRVVGNMNSKVGVHKVPPKRRVNPKPSTHKP